MFVAMDIINRTAVVKFYLPNKWTVAFMRPKPVFHEVFVIAYPTWIDQTPAPDDYIGQFVKYGPEGVDDITALKYVVEEAALFEMAVPPASMKVLQ